MKEFAKRLKVLRVLHGLTLMELGGEIGVSYANISRWESGKCLPGLEQVVKLAQFYNITTDFLLGINKEPINEKEKYLNFVMTERMLQLDKRANRLTKVK